MIIAPRRKVTSSQHLLVLNILIGNRQDLSSESKLSQRSSHRIIGKPRVGYSLLELRDAISSFLGWDDIREAVLVGTGDFGRALLGYELFRERGVEIVAAFDVAPDLVGQKVRGKEVLALDALGDTIRTRQIPIGIITTPAAAAQGVADTMVEAGAKAIWNFAPAVLEVPEHIILEHVELVASLAVLSSKLAVRASAE